VVTHKGSLGNQGRTEAGDVQVISAGTGIHTTWNNSRRERGTGRRGCWPSRPRVTASQAVVRCVPVRGARLHEPKYPLLYVPPRWSLVCRIQWVADLATPPGYTPRSLEHRTSPPTCSRRAFLQRKAWIEIRTPPASSR
jgi:hypothetical protein